MSLYFSSLDLCDRRLARYKSCPIALLSLTSRFLYLR